GDSWAVNQPVVEDEQTRVAVGEDSLQLLGLQERVQGGRYGASRDRAPETDRKEVSVREDQRDPVSTMDALPLERRREPPDELVELAEGRLLLIRDDRYVLGSILGGVAPDGPFSCVETVG